ncbi:hypothetical protein SAMN02745181_0362 [Rubritalea squalenifaciens DSM 18772]|uniref:Uncharacterized protein n=2 Tax=Rubritalea squalenifaciens TaxID=407226 RepID=A0A1M6C180_9BACT|nr:hypothetical protein SAMN02745181_0362 [Rubritalea squalenifaciens DSM 18772]
MKLRWFALVFLCCLFLGGGAFSFWENEVLYERTRGGTYMSANWEAFPKGEAERRAMIELGSDAYHKKMRKVLREELSRYITELSGEVAKEVIVSYEGDASGFLFTYSYKAALSQREERGLDGLQQALYLAVVKDQSAHVERGRVQDLQNPMEDTD